jgi:hypothetical protein
MTNQPQFRPVPLHFAPKSRTSSPSLIRASLANRKFESE